MTKSSSGKEEAQLERVLTADENIETALRMLERQQIPGLLPLDSVRKNDSLTVRYTVSGLSSLSAAENREMDNLRESVLKAAQRYSRKYSGMELRSRIYRYCAARGYTGADITAAMEEWNADSED